MSHTPTPWQVIPDYSQENVYRLWDLDGNFHDDTSPETMDANACFIVRACNAHEELVAALKEAIALIQSIPLTVRQVVESDTLRELSGINPYCINEGLAMGDEPYVLPTYKLEKILTTIEKGA